MTHSTGIVHSSLKGKSVSFSTDNIRHKKALATFFCTRTHQSTFSFQLDISWYLFLVISSELLHSCFLQPIKVNMIFFSAFVSAYKDGAGARHGVEA